MPVRTASVWTGIFTWDTKNALSYKDRPHDTISRMRITVTVKPGSKKGPLVQPDLLGGYLVYVREPALEGKANRAVVEMLAKFFDIPKTRVTLARGASSKIKIFEISDL